MAVQTGNNFINNLLRKNLNSHYIFKNNNL